MEFKCKLVNAPNGRKVACCCAPNWFHRPPPSKCYCVLVLLHCTRQNRADVAASDAHRSSSNIVLDTNTLCPAKCACQTLNLNAFFTRHLVSDPPIKNDAFSNFSICIINFLKRKFFESCNFIFLSPLRGWVFTSSPYNYATEHMPIFRIIWKEGIFSINIICNFYILYFLPR